MLERCATASSGGALQPSAAEMLLGAASDLMAEMETHDVSLHAIARRAGVTAPLVKYHFGNREGLLLALVDRNLMRLLEPLRNLVESNLDPATKLRLHIGSIIRNNARHPYLNGLLSHLLRGKSSDHVKSVFVQPLVNLQRAIVEQGIAAGRFRPVDPDQVYFVIMGACQSVFVSRVTFHMVVPDAKARDRFISSYADSAADMIVAGLHESAAGLNEAPS